MKIEKKEVHLLSLRLQIALEPYDIKLDTDMFEEMVRQDNGETTGAVLGTREL